MNNEQAVCWALLLFIHHTPDAENTMAIKEIFPAVHQLGLGPVNIFLVAHGAELTVIDTGYEKSTPQILVAAQTLGFAPAQITNIVVTHCHPDHAGSVADLQQATGAKTWMHAVDAAVVRGQTAMVRSAVAPGLLNKILFQLFIKNVAGHVPTAVVDHEIVDGDLLPVAGGLRAIYAPGHSIGHMAFQLERDGGLLFAADACSNMGFLAYSIVYDDIALGTQSLAKLAQINCHTICFGHGQPLVGKGVAKFQRKWGK